MSERVGQMGESPWHSHPEIMSGTPVFKGTRVPVQALFDYLEEGDTIESFLDAFPTVMCEQVIAFIEQSPGAFREPAAEG